MTNKQALDELLPCFGCKSVNISLTHIHGVRWGVQCHDCDLHTDPDAKTKEEATAHWNRYFRWFLVDIPERSMMQDRTEEYDDGYLNGFHDGQKPAITQPNQALVEALLAKNKPLKDCLDENQWTRYHGYQKAIHDVLKILSTTETTPQEPVNGMMLDALNACRIRLANNEVLEPEELDLAIAAASSAPVEVVGLEEAITELENFIDCEQMRIVIEAARLQLERQKMGGI